MVVVQAHLGRVAGEEEVLAVIVGDEDVLMAALEGIQFAVGVFFLLVEEDQVELVAVGQARAEDADGAIGVAENEAAEVAGERLRASPDGDEVVVGTQVGDLALHEVFLEGEPGPAARRALAHIGADHAELLHVQVVDVEDRRQLDTPVDRLEGGVAVEQVEA